MVKKPDQFVMHSMGCALSGQVIKAEQRGERVMSQYAALRANVGLLGTQLGDTVRNQLGPAVLERIEQIRHYAKQARKQMTRKINS